MIVRLRPILFIPCLALMLSAIACAQDCWASSVTVIGTITDPSGSPIEDATVDVISDSEFVCEGYQLRGVSGTDGEFRTNGISTWACCPFDVIVRAKGYQTFTARYYPHTSEGFTNELPEHLAIVLQPSP